MFVVAWFAGVLDAHAQDLVHPVLNWTWIADPDSEYAYFGTSVSSAGDVNGDGYGDVVVGAPLYREGTPAAWSATGRAYLYLGSAAGLGTTEAWTADSDQHESYFGTSVSAAGDVNGDGFGDVVVGAYAYDPLGDTATQDGRVYLYLGSASGLEQTAAWIAEPSEDAGFGYSVASAGDVNGDGYGDVVVGALIDGVGQLEEGRAYLYLGSASGLELTAAWTSESNQAFAYFGTSVSSAGDVNGDGYGDVVVGAPGYDNGEMQEGRVYVYLGSASGLETTASWMTEPNLVFAAMGTSVSSAGDVNGDGYGDVVVGSPVIPGGRVDVYLGSASGLEPTAATILGFGSVGSSAGDVNGDGYGDVVVGYKYYNGGQNDEGAAGVFLGSPTGLDATASWTGESNQAFASFGVSVSSAGDVNGDGFGDVIVGADDFHKGDKDEGRAYAYVGGCPAGAGLPFEDIDADFITDACDLCPGSDDRLDADEDLIPDGCEPCPPGGPDDVDSDFSCREDDCDDNDANVYPGAPERCDGKDTACAGAVPVDELDVDLDGAFLCNGDCDDNDPTSYPGATKLCDGKDNECDGAVSEKELDADGDGVFPCAGDCDDDDPTSYPGATELCDGGDNACAGVVALDELDVDIDGVLACAGDCDDGDPVSYPGAVELCDGRDNTCAGVVPADESDADADGVLVCEGDCDDDDPMSYPGATELCDGHDNACAGVVAIDELDADDDGVPACADCDDADSTASPAMTELCGDGVDNDCDGVVDQACAADPTGEPEGCGCDGSGVPGSSPLAVLAILAAVARRRRDETRRTAG